MVRALDGDSTMTSLVPSPPDAAPFAPAPRFGVPEPVFAGVLTAVFAVGAVFAAEAVFAAGTVLAGTLPVLASAPWALSLWALGPSSNGRPAPVSLHLQPSARLLVFPGAQRIMAENSHRSLNPR